MFGRPLDIDKAVRSLRLSRHLYRRSKKYRAEIDSIKNLFVDFKKELDNEQTCKGGNNHKRS